MIILGLVGTLCQKRASGMSYDRFQRFAKCGQSNLRSLATLGNDPNTSVIVLTSRNRVMCNSVLLDSPVHIGAENGLFLRSSDPTAEWKVSIQPRFGIIFLILITIAAFVLLVRLKRRLSTCLGWRRLSVSLTILPNELHVHLWRKKIRFCRGIIVTPIESLVSFKHVIC